MPNMALNPAEIENLQSVNDAYLADFTSVVGVPMHVAFQRAERIYLGERVDPRLQNSVAAGPKKKGGTTELEAESMAALNDKIEASKGPSGFNTLLAARLGLAAELVRLPTRLDLWTKGSGIAPDLSRIECAIRWAREALDGLQTEEAAAQALFAEAFVLQHLLREPPLDA